MPDATTHTTTDGTTDVATHATTDAATHATTDATPHAATARRDTDTSATAPTPPRRTGPRNVVAALWLTAILSYLYCDVLGSHDADYMRDILDGTGEVVLTQGGLLAASVLMTIPILGVLLSRIAGHRLARWYSLAAAAVMTLVQAASLFVGESTLYYLYFSVIEIATTSAIVWIAARRWTVDA